MVGSGRRLSTYRAHGKAISIELLIQSRRRAEIKIMSDLIFCAAVVSLSVEL
jgi:hypothetical protein